MGLKMNDRTGGFQNRAAAVAVEVNFYATRYTKPILLVQAVYQCHLHQEQ
jgi:hypothetical protein